MERQDCSSFRQILSVELWRSRYFRIRRYTTEESAGRPTKSHPSVTTKGSGYTIASHVFCFLSFLTLLSRLVYQSIDRDIVSCNEGYAKCVEDYVTEHLQRYSTAEEENL